MSKKILVVDDEEDILAITKLGLEICTDWNVLTANCGQEALKIADEYQPDVILLDMMMPDMDGRKVIQKLKANSSTQSIPVILLTAKAQRIDVENLNQLPVVAVLAKPFLPLELADYINEELGW